MDCTDWKGKSIMDGTDFNPKKEDPCYVCRCDNGQSTMCKTVSCAAPDCLYWRQIPGECCRFECLQTDLPDSVINGRENFTSSPPSGPNSKGLCYDVSCSFLTKILSLLSPPHPPPLFPSHVFLSSALSHR